MVTSIVRWENIEQAETVLVGAVDVYVAMKNFKNWNGEKWKTGDHSERGPKINV